MGLTPPLAIIQARVHSDRLPRKMLQLIGGKPLLRWAWDACIERFGAPHTLIACPSHDVGDLAVAVPNGRFYGFPGLEWDVLGRFHAAAHQRRFHSDDAIHRITPDDLPVELDREVFTLGQLDAWQAKTGALDRDLREHVGHLTGCLVTRDPETIEINTLEDLELARRKVGDL